MYQSLWTIPGAFLAAIAMYYDAPFLAAIALIFSLIALCYIDRRN